MKKKHIIFIFSHAVLFKAWEKAKKILEKQGIQAIIIGQIAPIDWENFCENTIIDSNAVYFHGTRHFSNFDMILEALKSVDLIVPGGIESASAMPHYDTQAAKTIKHYLKSGSVEDLVNAAKYLLYKAGVEDKPVAPSTPVICGIYDRTYEKPFLSFNDWTAFKKLESKDIPTVAILFRRNFWLDNDMALVDACITALESEGLMPLPIFCDRELAASISKGDHPLRKFLDDCRSLSAIWNILLSHSSGNSESDSVFTDYHVPVFQLIRNYTQSIEEWKTSETGLSPMTISFNVVQPEMMGCIEPTIVACTQPLQLNGIIGSALQAIPIKSRIQHLSKRTKAWTKLQRLPNHQKRITIILNNAPCKGVEATLAFAVGLDAVQSTVDLLFHLKQLGYQVENIPQDGDALIKLFLQKKAISEFRWTNVDEIVRKGGVLERVEKKKYLMNFNQLQPEVQKRMIDAWGEFPGEAMVHEKDGQHGLLVTGLKFGNITVMIEPKRGCRGPKCDGEVCRILHEPNIPPPHHWLAVYWYIQEQSDALIHMGSESPLDFLPGKTVGLGEECFPEISLGTLPHIYPYIMNATAGGLIAKRRSRAVLIDHLTPPKSRLENLDPAWDEMDELLRQFAQAKSVSNSNRQSLIRRNLKQVMESTGLIDPDLDEDDLDEEINLLSSKIQNLRKRVVELASHVLGTCPTDNEIKYYLSELHWKDDRVDLSGVIECLKKTKNEIKNLCQALSGRFVSPGPSGNLSSGKLDVLPSGRNFYGMDLKSIPTKAAYDIGKTMGQNMLLKFLQEEGHFPKSIGMSLWSSDAFQADGELTSQILWLLGCKPRWNEGGKVTGIDIIPAEELTMLDENGKYLKRPRIDILIHMSSIVRDTLSLLYQLIDKAVLSVSMLEEAEDINYVRAHVEDRVAELSKQMNNADTTLIRRLGTARLFSSKPGSFGDGIGLAIDASAWEDDTDLTETFINWTGHAYGEGMTGNPDIFGSPHAMFKEYTRHLEKIDISYQRAIGPEYDALSLSCYSAFQGGMATAKRALTGKQVKMYWGDTVTTETPTIRSLSEELDFALSTRLLNPEWFKQIKNQGYEGAQHISGLVNTLFSWSVTSRLVTKQQFDRVFKKYIENEENRRWLAEQNIYALEEITRRLFEASSRKLWDIDDEQLEVLHGAILEIEGDLEEKMGPIKGEFQGGSVDIKTRSDVKEWKYDYTLK